MHARLGPALGAAAPASSAPAAGRRPTGRSRFLLGDVASRLVRGVIAVVLTVALAGAHAEPVAGAATEVTAQGEVQLFANCFDACTLNVVLNGNGSGTWKSTNSSHVPNGLINCTWLNGAQAPGSDCTEIYCCVDRVSLVRVYFTLTPATGSEACYVDVCDDVGVDSFTDLPSSNAPISKTVGGTFRLLTYSVAISRAGSAANTGLVGIGPSGLTCPPECLAIAVTYGTQFTLTAVAAAGSYFDHWSGACQGQPAVCALTVTGPIDTTATFTLGSPPTASPPAPTQPAATPKATVKPAATPRTSTPPAATVAPVESGGPTVVATAGATVAPFVSPVGSAGLAATPAPSGAPIVAAVASTDLTPIALAILGAGLLIAIGIGAAAYLLRRRASPPPA